MTFSRKRSLPYSETSDRNLAVIDIGSNSIKLAIVKTFPGKKDFAFIGKDRVILPLAAKGKKAKIKKSSINKAAKVLKRYAKTAEHFDASVIAVATSAVREASNKQKFIKAVLKRSGIKVRAISGREEAELIFSAAYYSLSLSSKRSIMITIGGGSTEYVLARGSRIIAERTLKLGAKRLTDKFFPKGKLRSGSVRKCKDHLERSISLSSPFHKDNQKCVLVGAAGTVLSLAELILASKGLKKEGHMNGFSFSIYELRQIIDLLISRKTVKERRKIPGIEISRADIIVAGSLILLESMKKLGMNHITVTDYGLKEGLVLSCLPMI